MGYSQLTSLVAVSPNKTSPRNHVIDSVAIHTMAGNLSASACGELFQAVSTQASSNYGIDSAGVIAVYVDENDCSWCTSNRGVDNRAISIEVASTTIEEPFTVSDQAYESLIQLLVDICQRHNIASLKWANDEAYAKAAADGGPVDLQNMFVHRWFAPKTCPGEWLFTRQGQIANDVNARLANGETYTDGTALTLSGSESGVTINYEIIDPYMITLDRSSPNINYDMLYDSKVIGALVEAGYHYDSMHNVVAEFDSPAMAGQIQSLVDIDMDYGLYMTCRARNTVEVKEEMYRFSYPIRKYGPKLGIWLKLEISSDPTYNTPILTEYREQLIRLGYKGKMGIICERSFIDCIEWLEGAEFKKDYWLWLVEHISDTSEIDMLLDPTFFDIDGEG